jgi:hypothetical protein
MGKKIPTVRIVYGENFLRINQSDYDPQKHQLYEMLEPELEDSIAVSPSNGLIDLNSSELTEVTLTELSGIGKIKAHQIMESVPFPSLDEALKTFPCLEQHKERLTVSLLPGVTA